MSDWTRKDREQWLKGRKVHGVIRTTTSGHGIACRPSWSLASGLAYYENRDLRKITCKTCHRALCRHVEG